MEVSVNYLSILLAAVANMAIGFIYYSPAVLGKPWMKAMGYTPEQLKAEQKKMGKYYGLSFVVALITAYVLSHVMTLSANFYQYDIFTTGLMTAFWMWLGFVVPVQLTGEIFGRKSWSAFAINTGYQLIALLAMGAVIAFVG